MGKSAEKKQVFRYRLIVSIIRSSGLGYATAVFAAMFVACSLFVAVVEPGVGGVFDAVWFCFQAVTTIGFGDVVIVTPAARIATMILSVFAVFFIAVLTGAVVSYCSECTKVRHDESMVLFMDKLERLPELSKDELAELSEKIREHR